MENKQKYLLTAIFVTVLSIRLILAFTTPNLTYDSYFHLRHVENIAQTGIPLFEDPLSFGGRELHFLPLFHYIAAFFSLFIPLGIVAKVLPNLLITSLTIITYFISQKITKNKYAPLFTASIAGFLPILFNTNSFTVESLFLPLVFVAIYAFLDLKEKLWLYVVSFILLCFTSSTTMLLLIGFVIYILLSYTERKRIRKAEFEVILFSVFFFIWSQFVFFKDRFLEEGISFIWQNIPSQILLEYFPSFTILQSILLVSVIPFVVGIFVVYRSLFTLKTKKAFLLISFAISTTLLTWFKLIQFQLSLAFFSIILAILFAVFYEDVVLYLKKTKLSKQIKVFSILTIIILAGSMIFPAINVSLTQDTPQDDIINALIWLNQNGEENSGILAQLKEGHLITYYAKRKNIIDDQFSLIEDVEERFANHASLFSTTFQTQALSVLEKYDTKYLILSAQVSKDLKRDRFPFHDSKCFKQIFKEETRIYERQCILNEVENKE